MKTIIYTYLAAGLAFSCSVFAQSTKPVPVTGERVPQPTLPRPGTIQANPPNGTTTTQTGIGGQSTPASASAQFTTTSNAPVGTNTLAGTNGLNGTNNFAGTNGFGGTNGVVVGVNPTNPITKFPINTNTNFDGNVVVQDQAATPSDRILLTTLSQGVRATLGITPNGNTPVHFFIQNGTVTVTGTVQSTAQSQAVLAQVQQTPGVLSVIDDMHVSGPFAPAVQNGSNRSLLLGGPTDRAFSPADQALLTTVQQEAAFQLGVTSTAQMPVHFSIENGVVGVTGRVSSQQEKQALLAAIGRTQGIVRVVDNVTVIPTVSGGVVGSGNVGPSSVNGLLSPTSRNTNQLITTNSSGF